MAHALGIVGVSPTYIPLAPKVRPLAAALRLVTARAPPRCSPAPRYSLCLEAASTPFAFPLLLWTLQAPLCLTCQVCPCLVCQVLAEPAEPHLDLFLLTPPHTTRMRARSNVDACVHRLPAMLTSLNHSLNSDNISALLDNVLSSLALLPFRSTANQAAPVLNSPSLSAVPSGDGTALTCTSAHATGTHTSRAPSLDTVVGHAASPAGPYARPSLTDASGTAVATNSTLADAKELLCTGATTAQPPTTAGGTHTSQATLGTTDPSSACTGADTAMVHCKTGVPTRAGDVQTMCAVGGAAGNGGRGRDALAQHVRGAATRPLSYALSSMPGSSVASGAGSCCGNKDEARSAWGSMEHAAEEAGSDGKGMMSARVRKLLENAEAHAQGEQRQPLSYPVCMRTMTMMELCDGGSLLVSRAGEGG